MSRIRAWLQASRLLAYFNIAPPLILGQAWAVSAGFDFSWSAFFAIQVFGLLDHLFIVYANDVADFPGDVKNDAPTMFSGGSRVLVERKISPKALSIGAVVAAALMFATTILCAVLFGRPLAPVFAAAAVFLLWCYSFMPLRLSYRGHGEWLQAAGLGVVLPAFGFYVQSGTLSGAPALGFAAAVLLGFAGNITTALPDEKADRSIAKRSPVVRWGATPARWVASLSIAAASALAALSLESGGVAGFLLAGLGGLALVAPFVLPRRVLPFVLIAGGLVQSILIAWILVLLA